MSVIFIMDWKTLFLHVISALLLGALIGMYYKKNQMAGRMFSHAVVSTGTCLLVWLTQVVPGIMTDMPSVTACVLSGISLLGCGVMIRDGLNTHGLHAAATLICTAAIGVLCSMGLLIEATIGSLMILCANTLLYDLSADFRRQLASPVEASVQHYSIHVICLVQDEPQVRDLMCHNLGESHLRIQSLQSEKVCSPLRIEIQAEVSGRAHVTDQLESLVSRINLERGVSSARWQQCAVDRDKAF